MAGTVRKVEIYKNWVEELFSKNCSARPGLDPGFSQTVNYFGQLEFSQAGT